MERIRARRGRSRVGAPVPVAATVVLVLGAFAAATAQQVKVTVKIDRAEALDCTDASPHCRPEMYAVVELGNERIDNKSEVEVDNSVREGWEFSGLVDAGAGTVPVTIELWDQDPPPTAPDDHIDTRPVGGDRNLRLTVALALPCTTASAAVSGDVSGGCDQSFELEGGENPRGKVRFRVLVEAPPGVPNLHVACLHDPLLPDAGGTVKVTASVFGTAPAPLNAADVEVWIDDRTAPAQVCTPTSATGSTASSNQCTASRTPSSNQQTMAYGCLARFGGRTVWSGWRTTQIGTRDGQHAVPVVFTGAEGRSIDWVFIPDRDDYTDGARDSDFLTDVRGIINGAFYARDLFLEHQDRMNFWLAADGGDANGMRPEASLACQMEAPPDWNRDYVFADVGALVHTESFRDCARGQRRLFSAQPSNALVFLHESGHTPFGLADEYCCTGTPASGCHCDGGYFEAHPFPNVYPEEPECREDAPNLQRTSGQCRSFTSRFEGIIGSEPFWVSRSDYWLSEPSGDDLMEGSGAQTPQAADARRINWVFDECRYGRCNPCPWLSTRQCPGGGQ